LHWVHTSGMSADKAQEISINCNAAAAKHIKIAGWEVAGAWLHNIHNDIVENVPSIQTNLNEQVKVNSFKRASYNYNLITGKKLNDQ